MTEILTRRFVLALSVALVTFFVACSAAQPLRVLPAQRWAPPAGTLWQYQLQGPVDTSVDANVFIVDAFDVDRGLVEELRADGKRVICYISAGTFEDWRADAPDFPREVIGRPLADWPGESWLDVRRLDVLEPIMAARIDVCLDKGFDAVDPDNMDVYTQDSGFPVTADDQLAYNRMIAALAHERRLGVGLKNDVEQIPELLAHFDFAVNESCFAEDECERLTPFVEAGKAVLHVEYRPTLAEFCEQAAALGLDSIRKPRDLTAPIERCP